MSQPPYQPLSGTAPYTDQPTAGVPEQGPYGTYSATAEHGTIKYAGTSVNVVERPPAAEVGHSNLMPSLGKSSRRPASDEDDADAGYLKEFVRADFEDVIHEQPGTQVFDACNMVNKLTYTWSKVIWYHIFSLSCGILLSFWWGFWFALYSHIISWWWFPFYRLFKMTVYMWAIVYRTMCRAFMHPFYEAIALMFGNIRVNFTQHGTPQAPITSA